MLLICSGSLNGFLNFAKHKCEGQPFVIELKRGKMKRLKGEKGKRGKDEKGFKHFQIILFNAAAAKWCIYVII